MNKFLNEFSSQGGTAFVALTLILMLGLAVTGRFLFGKDFPTGYEGWLIFLGTLAGVNTAGMVLKRVTAKPEVIRAEGDAAATLAVAQTTGQFPAPAAATATAARDADAGIEPTP